MSKVTWLPCSRARIRTWVSKVQKGGRKRVGHDLATKQQTNPNFPFLFFPFLRSACAGRVPVGHHPTTPLPHLKPLVQPSVCLLFAPRASARLLLVIQGQCKVTCSEMLPWPPCLKQPLPLLMVTPYSTSSQHSSPWASSCLFIFFVDLCASLFCSAPTHREYKQSSRRSASPPCAQHWEQYLAPDGCSMNISYMVNQ